MVDIVRLHIYIHYEYILFKLTWENTMTLLYNQETNTIGNFLVGKVLYGHKFKGEGKTNFHIIFVFESNKYTQFQKVITKI